MGKLIKYEFRKSWMVKAIILAFTAIFEVMFLVGAISGNDDVALSSAVFLTFITICSIFIIGVLSIFILHKDLNTKQSYMLFMTPNSTFKILGAKIIENFGSILLFSAMFLLIGIGDITMWVAKSEGVKDMFNITNAILGEFGEDYQLDFFNVAISSAEQIVSWVFTIMVGFFAVVLSASFLNGRKFNGFISFIVFLVVTYIIEKIFYCSTNMIFGTATGYSLEKTICSIVYYIVLTVVLYIVTASIMDRKLSV